MVLAFQIQMEESLVTKRGHKRIMNKLNRQTLARHRDRELPKHFERNAMTSPGGAYGYKRRTLKYNRYKGRQKGHVKPLVFSGALRRTILATAKVRATASGGSLRATGPRVTDEGTGRSYWLLQFRKESREEIEAISPNEEKLMARRFARDYARYAERPEFQRKRKRK